MSDFCSTFAPNLNTIMEKRTYIQPKMAVEKMHHDASLMLLDSGSGTEPGKDTSAPARDAAGPKGVWL